MLLACVGTTAYTGYTIHADLNPPEGSAKTPVPLWLVLALANAGVVAALCLLAMAGVALRDLTLITAYVISSAVAMSAQLCCAVVLIVRSGSDGTPLSIVGAVLSVLLGDGGDPAGRDRMFMYLSAAAFGTEAATLCVTCLLQCSYQHATDLAADIEEEESAWVAGAARAPLLGAGARAPPPRLGHSSGARGGGGGQETEEWSRRMQERYGLDTSTLAYRPGEGPASEGYARRGERGEEQRERRHGVCAVM
ncbi:hypothetical protein FOA52_012779 [Chlamydomonas sp. UWO 241]|nr:hypothetical protein FOA52_012779 [Chlamydomonas sp. UWO 241]